MPNNPVIRTLLSLERFREIVGITPPHFWSGAGSTYFPDIYDCNGIFWHYFWQSQDNVSRIEIANAIRDAEEEIIRAIGYSPAPHWIEQEIQDYPRHHRRDLYEYGMQDVRGMNKSVQLNEGKFIQGGQRAVTLIDDEVLVVYSDEDGDGFDETATITTATSLTDACELKCYYIGESGNSDYEIRQPRSVTITGGNVIFVYWSWQLLDPELQQAFTAANSANPTPVDIEDVSSYVATVDVYREYNDFTANHMTLYWERIPVINAGLNIFGFCCSNCGGTGCPSCEFITQNGCLHQKNANGNFVVPVPAAYDSDAGQWQRSQLSVCRDPDMVKLYYYAGDRSNKSLSGNTCDDLSHWWAETIAWLAVARVNRPFCTCNNSQTLLNNLQRDLSFTGSRELGNYAVSAADLDNPFGTKLGEIRAWRRVSKMMSPMGIGVAV